MLYSNLIKRLSSINSLAIAIASQYKNIGMFDDKQKLFKKMQELLLDTAKKEGFNFKKFEFELVGEDGDWFVEIMTENIHGQHEYFELGLSDELAKQVKNKFEFVGVYKYPTEENSGHWSWQSKGENPDWLQLETILKPLWDFGDLDDSGNWTDEEDEFFNRR